jgi:probable rRNA maturation factor
MAADLRIRNESTRKRMYRSDVLTRLANRILEAESIHEASEVSILFCDDPFMTELNKEYRDMNRSTDVLSFEQERIPGQTPQVLGDIIISLETVESNCHGESDMMRDEVRMLVCHGLLHLLGYDHGTEKEKMIMHRKQAEYLGVSEDVAWDFGPKRKNTPLDSQGERNARGR